ncbi:Arylsulfatase [Symmachiella dynata]|uniref:Arylsulfatase n=1 Tax=Symmachiella dynata TaxID=2527995 RepID=A0A517ZM33_9PLAN|nr:sulfatase [Symmachiella dynata]QDU43543.1 Arylsulfatase [Symmachiella dynata]
MSQAFINRATVVVFAVLVLFASNSAVTCAEDKPNFIVIYCDNLGYGDIGCFGSTQHRTPNIDRMAAEGLKLTSFYVSSGVCTPSRASLMTGCYPRRVNLHESAKGGIVLRPVGQRGLHPNEITIAEVLKQQGYATACIGKWHLGDQPQFLPTRQGFDRYFGIPYSDDMTQRPGQPWPPLPLMEGEKVIEAPVDRNTLTKRYTEAAVEFIEQNRDRPFFLYLPHAMPGSTREPFASEAFSGKSANGAYGDSVEEIDWSTGEILKSLKELGLDERTMVVWTSDNGAPRRNPPQGSNQPLGGWGYTTQEGGMRVPCIVRQPGTVPAGEVSDELCTTMDLLPTFAKLSGGSAPENRIIDGKNIAPILVGDDGATSPHEAFYYYQRGQLQAVRSGKWKLHLALPNPRRQKQPRKMALYDVATDLGETTNLADEHPGIVKKLQRLAEAARKDLGDEGNPGENQRAAGHEPHPTPRELTQQ